MEYMQNYRVGDKYIIHSYKHDGNIHRSWDEAILLDANSEYLVFADDHTRVVESDGRSWYTKEPAIMFYYKHSWYNIIGQMKEDGIYYYCNLASPYVIEDKTLKYIDYDLDLRVFPDGAFKILDRGEYNYHKKLMSYPESIDRIVRDDLTNLINLARSKEKPFNKETVDYYYNLYCEMKKK